jgi:pimeloyl-ACP methyl ester carboxylesterase
MASIKNRLVGKAYSVPLRVTTLVAVNSESRDELKQRGAPVATYVLIHGAWRGSWTLKRVRDQLAAAGHQVFTPTLTGLGERAHLLSRNVGLGTHIEDVTNLLIWEELRDVVLVGASYGGCIVRHVADRMRDRVRSLVYVDAFVPEDGKCVADYEPNFGTLRALAADHGDGWKIPPPPASYFGVNAADAGWVDRQCTMHPLSTLETPAQLSGACDEVGNIGYILARNFPNSPFPQFDARAADRGWWRAELPCGHDITLDMPNKLTMLLLERT